MSCIAVGTVSDKAISAHPQHALSRPERPDRTESYEDAGRTERQSERHRDAGRCIERQNASKRSDADEHRVKEHEADRSRRGARREPAAALELVRRPAMHDEGEHPRRHDRDNGFAHSSNVLRNVGRPRDGQLAASQVRNVGSGSTALPPEYQPGAVQSSKWR